MALNWRMYCWGCLYLLSDQCTVSIKLATFAGSGRLEFQASAIRLLKYMSDNGMIKRVGSGKSTRYIK